MINKEVKLSSSVKINIESSFINSDEIKDNDLLFQEKVIIIQKIMNLF